MNMFQKFRFAVELFLSDAGVKRKWRIKVALCLARVENFLVTVFPK